MKNDKNKLTEGLVPDNDISATHVKLDKSNYQLYEKLVFEVMVTLQNFVLSSL